MDYSAVAFAIAAYVILYLVFLRLRPALAQLWLCFGGGVIGRLALGYVLAVLAVYFGPTGLLLWAILFAIIVGGPAGGWLVWHLTRPERADR